MIDSRLLRCGRFLLDNPRIAAPYVLAYSTVLLTGLAGVYRKLMFGKGNLNPSLNLEAGRVASTLLDMLRCPLFATF